jgi:predicted HNH restriction endonuclease
VEYAVGRGKSRCPKHEAEARKKRTASPGTTPSWHRARRAALARDGYRCQKCGRTQAEAKKAGRTGKGLHVHHVDGVGSSRDETHDVDKLTTLCELCHNAVRAKKTRPTLEEWKAQIRARARRA